MSLALSKTRCVLGIYARSVSVEVHLSSGLPTFTIVGLAETAVKESKDRVRSAIINSQFEFPCRKIIVNLAPADLPKTSSGFDLPIAIGILAASGQIPQNQLDSHEFIGELALSGHLRGTTGIIPIILAAHREEKTLIIAEANVEEAAIVRYPHVYAAKTLTEVCNYLSKQTPLLSLPECPVLEDKPTTIDWSDIKGQQHAKQAMFIAAAGGHSILLSGPPGSGKTMLAKRFPTLLPNLSEQQAMECAAITSLHGRFPNYQEWRLPPFRAPHHTASTVALVGGGNPPKPGEISLAHHGVLFLDELPEFNRHVLETLREPLESGHVNISRAAAQIVFPAQFQLLAAMNPCPCGQWGNSDANCFCTPERINRYITKLSAPFLDRIDMHVSVQALSQSELLLPLNTVDKTSPLIKAQVEKLREVQWLRQNCLNAHLDVKQCESSCALGHEELGFLSDVLSKLKLSARAYHRLLKVARTISDIQEKETVDLTALRQALSFKQTLQSSKG